MRVVEVGSWNNVYRGVNGFHYAALGEKMVKKKESPDNRKLVLIIMI